MIAGEKDPDPFFLHGHQHALWDEKTARGIKGTLCTG